MNTGVRITAFAAALAATFGTAYGVGKGVGPVGEPAQAGHGEHAAAQPEKGKKGEGAHAGHGEGAAEGAPRSSSPADSRSPRAATPWPWRPPCPPRGRAS